MSSKFKMGGKTILKIISTSLQRDGKKATYIVSHVWESDTSSICHAPSATHQESIAKKIDHGLCIKCNCQQKHLNYIEAQEKIVWKISSLVLSLPIPMQR